MIHPGCETNPNALHTQPMKRSAGWILGVTLFFFSIAFTAQAGTEPQMVQQTEQFDKDSEKVPLDIFETESSYVFESDLNHGGSFGKQDELQNHIYYAHRFQLTGNWYARIGADYDRYDFGNTSAPVPVHLQSGAAVFSVDYMHGDDIGAMLEIRP